MREIAKRQCNRDLMHSNSVMSLVAKALDVRALDVKAFEGFFTHSKMGCIFPFSSWYQRNVVYVVSQRGSFHCG